MKFEAKVHSVVAGCGGHALDSATPSQTRQALFNLADAGSVSGRTHQPNSVKVHPKGVDDIQGFGRSGRSGWWKLRRNGFHDEQGGPESNEFLRRLTVANIALAGAYMGLNVAWSGPAGTQACLHSGSLGQVVFGLKHQL